MSSFIGRSRTISEESVPESSNRRNSTSSINTNIIERILNSQPQYNQNIEELIDPEQDYNRFQTHGLQLLNPENLYNRGNFESRTQFFRHTREVSIQCLDGQVRQLSLISEESTRLFIV